MTEAQIRTRINDLHLGGTPAESIVTRPGHGLWVPPNAAAVAEQLCRNVYWYGHHGARVWSWPARAGQNPTGELLANGTRTDANCGGFNLAAMWIGYNVLGLLPEHFFGSFTLANEPFITQPGTVPIDRNWQGNVRTLREPFAVFRACYFWNHSFCSYAGNLMDAATGTMNFHNKDDLFWAKLDRVYLDDPTGARAFMVTHIRALPPLPGPAPYALVGRTCLRVFRHMFPVVQVDGVEAVTQRFINELPEDTGAGWEPMLLVSRDHLPAEFNARVNLLPLL